MEQPSPTSPNAKHFRFEGRVIPEVRNVTIPKVNPVHISDPWGFHGDIDISVVNGRVNIDCVCFDEVARADMCVARCFECVTGLVDLYAYTKGWNLTVILDAMIVDGSKSRLAVSEKGLPPLVSSIADDEDFRAVSALLLKKFNLKFALHDLIVAIGALNYPHIGTARSMEAIRGMIAPDARNESEAWRTMRSLLNIERDYLQRITDASRGPRHGDRGGATGDTQMTVMQRAWTIMDRYLEFLKRGGETRLPLSEYPFLCD